MFGMLMTLVAVMAVAVGAMELSLVGVPAPAFAEPGGGESSEGCSVLYGLFWAVAGMGVLSAVA